MMWLRQTLEMIELIKVLYQQPNKGFGILNSLYQHPMMLQNKQPTLQSQHQPLQHHLHMI